MANKSKIRLEIPERGSNEPDATEKQLRFIEHLLDEIEAENLPLELDNLGKWQASSLIDCLITFRDGIESDKVIIKDHRGSSGGLLKLLFWLIVIFLIICWLVF
jgi:hypothetical protein